VICALRSAHAIFITEGATIITGYGYSPANAFGRVVIEPPAEAAAA
jgi:hypothetical protein